MLWQMMFPCKMTATFRAHKLAHLQVDLSVVLIEVWHSWEFFSASWTLNSAPLQENKRGRVIEWVTDKGSMSADAHSWGDYPGTLSCSQVSATPFEDGAFQDFIYVGPIFKQGAEISLKLGYQVSSLSDGHQNNMLNWGLGCKKLEPFIYIKMSFHQYWKSCYRNKDHLMIIGSPQ